MGSRRSFLPVGIFFFVLFLIVIFVALEAGKNRIVQELKTFCPECEFSLGSIRVNPFERQIVVSDLRFLSPKKRVTTVEVICPRIVVENVQEIFSAERSTSELRLENLVVNVLEMDAPNAPPPSAKEIREFKNSYLGSVLEGLPKFVVRNLVLENATLNYAFHIFNRDAKIAVSNIFLETSPIASRRESMSRWVDAHLTGTLQNSGRVTVDVKVDLYSVENQDSIEIRLEEQNLAELDSFFFVEDGIRMKGFVEDAHAKMQLTRGFLFGSFETRYRELELSFHSTPEVGVIETVIAAIVQDVKIAPSKPMRGFAPPTAVIRYRRKPGQAITKFVLEGMKEAAFEAIEK